MTKWSVVCLLLCLLVGAAVARRGRAERRPEKGRRNQDDEEPPPVDESLWDAPFDVQCSYGDKLATVLQHTRNTGASRNQSAFEPACAPFVPTQCVGRCWWAETCTTPPQPCPDSDKNDCTFIAGMQQNMEDAAGSRALGFSFRCCQAIGSRFTDCEWEELAVDEREPLVDDGRVIANGNVRFSDERIRVTLQRCAAENEQADCHWDEAVREREEIIREANRLGEDPDDALAQHDGTAADDDGSKGAKRRQRKRDRENKRNWKKAGLGIGLGSGLGAGLGAGLGSGLVACWTVHLEGGPRRVNHAAVSVGERVFSFGGYCCGEDYERRRPMDVHVLNTHTYRWRQLRPPAAQSEQAARSPYQRYGHSAVVYAGAAFIWGGRNDGDGASDVLHRFDPATSKWEVVRATGCIPPARDGHSACVIGDQMLVFGGFEEDFQRFSQETYSFDLRANRWAELRTWGVAPAWRDFHTATAIGKRMYVFGGRSDQLGQYHSNREVYFDRLKYLDTTDSTWHEATVGGSRPSGRRSHSAWCYDDKLYIFGGYSGESNKHFGSLFEYDTNGCWWRELQPYGEEAPRPRRRQCTVVVGERVFLFGGTASVSPAARQSVVGERFRPVESSSSPSAVVDEATSTAAAERQLVDLSDLYVLDYAPSLKDLSAMAVIGRKRLAADMTVLPRDVQRHLRFMTTPNRMLVPRAQNSG